MSKIDKHFVSEIDKKMVEFDATHVKSPTQIAELKKYQQIYKLRDVPTDQLTGASDLWE